MTASRIELIKDLRNKGASIRMIDDVAAYLDAYGGYSSPVFVATVEFIIKIKDMLKSMLAQKAQAQGINSEIVEKARESAENVNFNAAKTAVNNDEETPVSERQVIIDHIDAVALYKDNNVETEHLKQEHAPNANQSFANNVRRSRQKARQGKNTILDKLFKIASILSGQKNNQKQQAHEMQQINARSSARQQQEQAQHNVQEVNQRASLLRISLTKMNLLSSLKIGKDKSIYGNAQWREKQAALNAKPQDEKIPARREQIMNNQNASQKQEGRAPKDKKIQEVSISQVIDEAVKTSKNKKTAAVEKPSEKGKFEKATAERAGPRADDKKVAEMAAKDAIANLQNSGVRSSGATVRVKPEVEVQVAQQKAAAQQAQIPKQR